MADEIPTIQEMANALDLEPDNWITEGLYNHLVANRPEILQLIAQCPRLENGSSDICTANPNCRYVGGRCRASLAHRNEILEQYGLPREESEGEFEDFPEEGEEGSGLLLADAPPGFEPLSP